MQKPLFQHIYLTEETSYNILRVDRPHFVVPWHFHPEVEIMYVVEGEGSRIVGDSIENYTAGDLVLVGANVPHCWKSGPAHTGRNSRLRSKAIVALFQTDCFGKDFFRCPEFKAIKALLQKAERGISFGNKTKAIVCPKLADAFDASGVKRFVLFMEILHALAQSDDCTLLSSNRNEATLQNKDMQRLNVILDFLVKNFKRPVTLEEISAQAFMSPQAFCRYFKGRTNKTVVGFLNELRISHAKRLLASSDANIDVIGTESGFLNLSNFYEQFRKVVGCSPNHYRNKMRMHIAEFAEVR